MRKRSDPVDWEELRSRILGFGEHSRRKTYYPELRRSEAGLQRLAAAVEQAAEGILIADAQGVVLYANSAHERLTGEPAASLVGGNLREIWRERHGASLADGAWTHVLEGGTWTGHVRARRPDGAEYEAEVTLSPVRGESGQVADCIVVERDVTNEVALERLARKAQRLDALGTLAGGIAHDLNNLLMPISGFSELALRAVGAEHPAVTSIEAVLEAVDRARVLVRQILTFSRQAEQERHPTDLVPIVEEALRFVRSGSPPSVALEARLTTERAVVLADPTQLHQVTVNLLTNAVQATAAGGTVSIEVCETTLDAVSGAAARGLPPGRYVRLAIRDDGAGIPPEIQEQIFDPFFTTKEVGRGTGLGLSVVHGIVKSHGGTVSLDSEVGRGSRFTVHLPASAENPLRVDLHDDAPPRGTERVLLVDDEPPIAALGRQMLEGVGYTVLATTRSEEALEWFTRAPETFDVLVTDEAMPRLPGTALIRAVRALRPELPAVVCTGLLPSARTGEAFAEVEVVLKPARLLDLARAVRRALDGRDRT